MVKPKLMGEGLLLKAGTLVDTTLIAAPSSTKNSKGRRDPEILSETFAKLSARANSLVARYPEASLSH